MKNPYQSKKRNTGARKRKRDILIAAEGKNKTERLYFSNFNSDSISVRFSHGNETDPLSLSKNLRNEYKNLELSPQSGDQAFCIVDEDLSPSQEQLILQAQKVLKHIHGEVIVSNPCFEIWYLCHFRFSTKQFSTSQETVTELRKHIPDYVKGDKSIYSLLCKDTNIAICNAKKLKQFHEDNNTNSDRFDCQPRTDVYKVVEAIQNK